MLLPTKPSKSSIRPIVQIDLSQYAANWTCPQSQGCTGRSPSTCNTSYKGSFSASISYGSKQQQFSSWSTGQAPLPCKWSGSNADLFIFNHRPGNAMCFHMQGPRVLSMTADSFCAFHLCAVAMNMPMSTVWNVFQKSISDSQVLN
jgi:hypothetical protein